MTIFLASLQGLESKQDTHLQLGLTKKQYYTRLKQLVELNLIEKKNTDKKKKSQCTPFYVPTLIGKIVFKKCITWSRGYHQKFKKT